MTTININNLSKEQLEDLEKQIAEAKNKLTTSYGRKRADIWEDYYLTEEQVEQARDRQLAIVRVNDAIDKLNREWKPNYNTNDYKYYIGYDYKNSQKFELYWDIFTDYQNIIKPLRWRDNSSQEFISEYENDLKIIFNIK